MFSKFKKSSRTIEIPTEETEEVEIFQSWTVRWVSLHALHENLYIVRNIPEVEVFINYKEACRFKDELKRAFSLLKHTGISTCRVTLEENLHE